MARLSVAVTQRQKYVFHVFVFDSVSNMSNFLFYSKVCLANAASLPCPDLNCDTKTAGLNGKTCQRYATSKVIEFIHLFFVKIDLFTR